MFFVEVLMFGIFSVLYPIAIWILVYRRRRSRRTGPVLWMCGIVTAMFLLSAANIAVDAQHSVAIFVDNGATPGGSAAYVHRQGSPSYLVDPIVVALLTLMGDSFMTYRVFILWGRKPISLVTPILLLMGDLIAASYLAKALYKAPGSIPDILFTPQVYPSIIAYFVMALITNIVTVGLLLGRIMWSERSTRTLWSRAEPSSTSVHWQVMKTVIQSEAMYSIALILNLIACAARSDLALITISVLPYFIAIAFTLIIARISLSEVLGNTRSGPSTDTGAVSLDDRRAMTSPIAINVLIYRRDDSDHASGMHDGKVATVPHVVEDPSIV
ncbi:hypothetical protein BD413DRAFT_471162 [Trametes elegans]|nr:hypothetical protein BD413DRAFT_471162 [Trametes elegans]